MAVIDIGENLMWAIIAACAVAGITISNIFSKDTKEGDKEDE